jgi:hypothetical protein
MSTSLTLNTLVCAPLSIESRLHESEGFGNLALPQYLGLSARERKQTDSASGFRRVMGRRLCLFHPFSRGLKQNVFGTYLKSIFRQVADGGRDDFHEALGNANETLDNDAGNLTCVTVPQQLRNHSKPSPATTSAVPSS